MSKLTDLHDLIAYYENQGIEYVPLELFRILLARIDRIAVGLEALEDEVDLYSWIQTR